ncbi:MAG: alpha/beta hydrolase [Pseudomonadota bacterium]
MVTPTPHAHDADGPPVRPLATRVQDDIVLRGSLYHGGAGADERRPVVCLAGLSRNGRDFTMLARAIARSATPRNVYTFDMRGRGASDWAPKWTTYTIMQELSDTLDLMTAHGLFDCALIGTSRGGLLGMGLMALQPTRIGAIVLNDIGPVIDREGLMRIAGYVGKMPTPTDWDDAVRLIKAANARDFPKLDDAEWHAVARQWFNADDAGGPKPGYDPDIARTFEIPDGGFPELWPQFEAVTPVPCLTIRGQNSDLLSVETVERMAARHPDFESRTVPDQGHAPLLREDATIAAIIKFLDRTEGA